MYIKMQNKHIFLSLLTIKFSIIIIIFIGKLFLMDTFFAA